MPFHHHAHLKDGVVAVGQIVDIGTLLGHVGKSGLSPGAGAHDHYEVSKNKPSSWTFYPTGKPKAWVAANYIDPKKYINESQNLPCKWTNKTAGNRYLQYYAPHRVYHPGEDLNSGTGDQDLGNDVKSTCYGRVVFAAESKGWGNHIWVEELPKPGLQTTFLGVTIVANKIAWDYKKHLPTLSEWFKGDSQGKLEVVPDTKETQFNLIPLQEFNDKRVVDINWYRQNITPLATGQGTLLLLNPDQYQGTGTWGYMTYGDPERPVRMEITCDDRFVGEGTHLFVDRAFHEICHMLYFLTRQKDRTHELLNVENPVQNRSILLGEIDQKKLQDKLVTIKKG